MSLPAWLVPPPESAFIPLPRAALTRDALSVARDLLGRFVVHAGPEGRTVGRIVETEAYLGPEDKAAHVFGGKRTPRTEVFWKNGGHAYVYLIYGMHHCFNVVAGKADEPCAVLVRALEPVEGVDLMEARRNITMSGNMEDRMRDMANLLNGPGKLCQAMGITKQAHYGHDLTKPPLQLTHGTKDPADDVSTGPRVNVDYADEYARLPYRFWLTDSPCVSKP